MLSVVGKLFTGLLADRIGDFLEKGDLLANEQNGVRPGRSCVDHIFTLCDLLRTRKAKNLETLILFIC